MAIKLIGFPRWTFGFGRISRLLEHQGRRVETCLQRRVVCMFTNLKLYTMSQSTIRKQLREPMYIHASCYATIDRIMLMC